MYGNNNNDSEASLVSQVDYQTAYNDTRDEMEEEKQKEETEKRRCLTWLVEQMKDKQKNNVWRHTYQSYYPFIKTHEGQEVSVQTMTSTELHKYMNDFQNRFDRASDQVKNNHYPFARAYKVFDDIYHDYSKKNVNDDVFEEEEEEVQIENDETLSISEAAQQQQSVFQLSNIDELSNGYEELAIENGDDEIHDEPSYINPQPTEKPKRIVNIRSFQRKPQ